jgi:hypothetical protein
MLYVLVALVLLGVWLFCLFDALAADEADIRSLPKFAWFLIVLLGFLIGAALWLIFGKPRTAPATGGGHGPTGPTGPAYPPPPGSPKGPDDDPDFLRNLDRRIKGDD